MLCQHQDHWSDRFSMRSCPERAYILAFFALPLPCPLSDKNPVMLHFFAYAEIIFADILVFPACAIEVQHISENSPTIVGTSSRKQFWKTNVSVPRKTAASKIINDVILLLCQLRRQHNTDHNNVSSLLNTAVLVFFSKSLLTAT